MVVLRRIDEGQQLDLFSWEPKPNRPNLPKLELGSRPKGPLETYSQADKFYFGSKYVPIGQTTYDIGCSLKADFVRDHQDVIDKDEYGNVLWPVKQTPEELANMLANSLRWYYELTGTVKLIRLFLRQTESSINTHIVIWSDKSRRWMDLQNYAGMWLERDIRVSAVNSNGITLSVDSITIRPDRN